MLTIKHLVEMEGKMSDLYKSKPDEKPFVSLQETVIIGYADIAAAGCRALLGVSGHKTEVPVEIYGIANPACCSTGEKSETDLKPLLVYNCNYMLYSFVIANSHVSAKQSHRLAKYIVEACSHSKVRRIIVLAALRLDIVEAPVKSMYENSWNGMKPLTSCRSLPPEIKFCDAFLSNLMQMLLIEGIAFSCFFCPANKAEPGKASDYDGSLEVIATMQQYLGDITLLGFSLDNSKSLIYRGNANENTDMVARIYV